MGSKQSARLAVVVPLAPREPVTGESWRDQGACAEAGAALFFADDAEDRQEARGLCAECPVRLRCLAAAVAMREKHGVWAGYDLEVVYQRRAANREAARIAAAAVSPVAA